MWGGGDKMVYLEAEGGCQEGYPFIRCLLLCTVFLSSFSSTLWLMILTLLLNSDFVDRQLLNACGLISSKPILPTMCCLKLFLII